LYRDATGRTMSGMTDTLPPLPAAAAAQLDDQTVHVWHLGYRRAPGRHAGEPSV